MEVMSLSSGRKFCQRDFKTPSQKWSFQLDELAIFIGYQLSPLVASGKT